MLLAVLAFAADEAWRSIACWDARAKRSASPVPAPALSHERVHEKVKLGAAIVRRSGGWDEVEVVVHHLD